MSSEALRKEWTTLYRNTLPSLAKKRSSAQPKWPVYLDHCFARIILDNAVGETQPWTKVLKSPAVKHMDDKQLKASIKLGKDIADGKVDLVRLDNKSLELRGKKHKGATSKAGSTSKDGTKVKNKSSIEEDSKTPGTGASDQADKSAISSNDDDDDQSAQKLQEKQAASKNKNGKSARSTRASIVVKA